MFFFFIPLLLPTRVGFRVSRGCDERGRVGRRNPESGSCPLLAGWKSALLALMRPDMKIMFAFSFPQLSWCVMKLKLTVPYHQAEEGPVVPSAV